MRARIDRVGPVDGKRPGGGKYDLKVNGRYRGQRTDLHAGALCR